MRRSSCSASAQACTHSAQIWTTGKSFASPPPWTSALSPVAVAPQKEQRVTGFAPTSSIDANSEPPFGAALRSILLLSNRTGYDHSARPYRGNTPHDTLHRCLL